jgi:phenylpropionate dioxygenase-like ring-hydroxylating dioxygenase large terminal subunit
MIVPIGVKSHGVGDQESIDPYQQFMMREAGVDPRTFGGTAREVRTAIQQVKRERCKRFVLDYYDTLTDAQLTDSWATCYLPNVQIGMHPEAVFVMRFLPHTTDPERFYYDNMTLFRYVPDPGYSMPGWMGLPTELDTTGETRPNIERIPVDVKPNLREVLNQDVELVAAVQRGSKSKGFRGPLWSQQEDRVRHFHRELDRYING